MIRPVVVLFALITVFGIGPVNAEPVNINTADAKTLANALDGVGPAYSQRIVEYRKTHGRFESPQELMNVPGIGPKTLASNRKNILLSADEPVVKDTPQRSDSVTQPAE